MKQHQPDFTGGKQRNLPPERCHAGTMSLRLLRARPEAEAPKAETCYNGAYFTHQKGTQ